MINSSLLKRIKYFYGLNQKCSHLIKSYLTSSDNSDESSDLQQDLIDYILSDKLLSKYPVNKKFKQNFIKTIISQLEELNLEVNETLFQSYIQLLNDQQDETHFLIFYPLDNQEEEEPIVIEQYSSIISKGTTGLFVWPACYLLVEYLRENKSLIENKIVLELGTGLGLLGLNCLFKLRPKQYVFTDSHSEVITQLKKNLGYNHFESLKECKDKKVLVEQLDWCHLEDCSFLMNETISFDVLLASDIIFDPDIIPDLVKTLRYISITKSECLIIYISSTIRNEATYQIFINCLEKEKFIYKKVKTALNESDNTQIEILEIKLII